MCCGGCLWVSGVTRTSGRSYSRTHTVVGDGDGIGSCHDVRFSQVVVIVGVAIMRGSRREVSGFGVLLMLRCCVFASASRYRS
jgi:hypothetical protein